MVEIIGNQQAVAGAAGHEKRTATPPAPLGPREPLTPGQFFALPDIGQMQESAGQMGKLAQARKKIETAKK
ncbi:hypothetical protein KKE75_04190 [Patescibacteria group bacterium]|nr:hypothetical protein [Patescibacteria group bacterium]